MDLYNDLINEVLMSEVSTKGWREFEQKYLPLAHRQDLFVQFTKFADNTDDKRFVGQQNDRTKPPSKPGDIDYDPEGMRSTVGGVYPAGMGKKSGFTMSDQDKKLITPDLTLWASPNHKDPTAIYTYPLEYVVHHPTSIPYGAPSPYLRVLRLRSGAKVLDLQSLTKDRALTILKAMGLIQTYMGPALEDTTNEADWYEKLWQLGVAAGKDKFSPHPVTVPKVFFLLAQSGQWKKSLWGDEGSFTTLNNNSQRERFIKAGIQVVQDTARNDDEAVIHSNEPEQCFFMDRAAFDIVDVFEVATVPRGSYHNDFKAVDYKHTQPKVAAKILSYLDPKDAIAETKQIRGGIQALTNPLKMSGVINLRAPFVITTRRGRAIEIEQEPARKEQPEGTPHHRRSGRHLDSVFDISIYSETGTHTDRIDGDEELDTAARRISAAVHKGTRDTEWRPVRGVPNLGEEWRTVLQALPGSIRKGYYQEINIDGALEGAGMVCDMLVKLFATVGWKWIAPQDPWEQAACWVGANKIYHRMLKFDRLISAYDDGVARCRKEIGEVLDGTSYEAIEKTTNKFKGTPVEKPATLLTHAGRNGWGESGVESLITLAHNLETMFHKRWLIMMKGAYPNFDEDIGSNLRNMIEQSEKKGYEEELLTVWDAIFTNDSSASERSKKSRFYERTGERPETWGFEDPKKLNEVIVGSKFSVSTPNVGGNGGAMPEVWKDPSKEASFSAPSKKGTKDPRVARAKAEVEKVMKRHLTWLRDPSTGSETAYIGHGKKVRIGYQNVTQGPMVIPLQVGRLPKDLARLLA